MNMKIPVIYYDGKHGLESPERLDELIDLRVVTAFRRMNEWVGAAKCRHRGFGGDYFGPERREKT